MFLQEIMLDSLIVYKRQKIQVPETGFKSEMMISSHGKWQITIISKIGWSHIFVLVNFQTHENYKKNQIHTVLTYVHPFFNNLDNWMSKTYFFKRHHLTARI